VIRPRARGTTADSAARPDPDGRLRVKRWVGAAGEATKDGSIVWLRVVVILDNRAGAVRDGDRGCDALVSRGLGCVIVGSNPLRERDGDMAERPRVLPDGAKTPPGSGMPKSRTAPRKATMTKITAAGSSSDEPHPTGRPTSAPRYPPASPSEVSDGGELRRAAERSPRVRARRGSRGRGSRCSQGRGGADAFSRRVRSPSMSAIRLDTVHSRGRRSRSSNRAAYPG